MPQPKPRIRIVGVPSALTREIERHMEVTYGEPGEGGSGDLTLWWNPGLSDRYEDLISPGNLVGAYFIDSHFSFPWQAALSPLFDFLVLDVQSAARYFPAFDADRIGWCPFYFPGGDDECAQSPPDRERPIDVAFVGGLKPGVMPHRARFFKALEEKLAGRYRIHLGPTPLSVAEVYAQTKVVVNYTTRPDWAYTDNPLQMEPHTVGMNQRVFEAMGYGAMLLNDSSVTDLEVALRRGEHFETYACNDVDDTVRQIGRYLSDESARLRIARAGWEEVRRAHTLSKRGGSLAQTLAGLASKSVMPKMSEDERRAILAGALLRMAVHIERPTDRMLEMMGSRLEHARSILDPLFAPPLGGPCIVMAEPGPRPWRGPSKGRALLTRALLEVASGRARQSLNDWSELGETCGVRRAALSGLQCLLHELGEYQSAHRISHVLAQIALESPDEVDPVLEAETVEMAHKCFHLGVRYGERFRGGDLGRVTG